MPQEKPKPTEVESGVDCGPDSGSHALDIKVQGAGKQKPKAVEIGGRKGPEPTRYGDWEKNGIISDF